MQAKDGETYFEWPNTYNNDALNPKAYLTQISFRKNSYGISSLKLHFDTGH